MLKVKAQSSTFQSYVGHTHVCFCWRSLWHFTAEESVQCLPPGYSWSLRLVPAAMQECHLAPDTPVLIITVHSRGLLFHWHREKGQSFAGYGFIPLPCWVSAALHEAQASVYSWDLSGYKHALFLCCLFYLPDMSTLLKFFTTGQNLQLRSPF